MTHSLASTVTRWNRDCDDSQSGMDARTDGQIAMAGSEMLRSVGQASKIVANNASYLLLLTKVLHGR